MFVITKQELLEIKNALDSSIEELEGIDESNVDYILTTGALENCWYTLDFVKAILDKEPIELEDI